MKFQKLYLENGYIVEKDDDDDSSTATASSEEEVEESSSSEEDGSEEEESGEEEGDEKNGVHIGESANGAKTANSVTVESGQTLDGIGGKVETVAVEAEAATAAAITIAPLDSVPTAEVVIEATSATVENTTAVEMINVAVISTANKEKENVTVAAVDNEKAKSKDEVEEGEESSEEGEESSEEEDEEKEVEEDEDATTAATTTATPTATAATTTATATAATSEKNSSNKGDEVAIVVIKTENEITTVAATEVTATAFVSAAEGNSAGDIEVSVDADDKTVSGDNAEEEESSSSEDESDEESEEEDHEKHEETVTGAIKETSDTTTAVTESASTEKNVEESANLVKETTQKPASDVTGEAKVEVTDDAKVVVVVDGVEEPTAHEKLEVLEMTAVLSETPAKVTPVEVSVEPQPEKVIEVVVAEEDLNVVKAVEVMEINEEQVNEPKVSIRHEIEAIVAVENENVNLEQCVEDDMASDDIIIEGTTVVVPIESILPATTELPAKEITLFRPIAESKDLDFSSSEEEEKAWKITETQRATIELVEVKTSEDVETATDMTTNLHISDQKFKVPESEIISYDHIEMVEASTETEPQKVMVEAEAQSHQVELTPVQIPVLKNVVVDHFAVTNIECTVPTNAMNGNLYAVKVKTIAEELDLQPIVETAPTIVRTDLLLQVTNTQPLTNGDVTDWNPFAEDYERQQRQNNESLRITANDDTVLADLNDSGESSLSKIDDMLSRYSKKTQEVEEKQGLKSPVSRNVTKISRTETFGTDSKIGKVRDGWSFIEPNEVILDPDTGHILSGSAALLEKARLLAEDPNLRLPRSQRLITIQQLIEQEKSLKSKLSNMVNKIECDEDELERDIVGKSIRKSRAAAAHYFNDADLLPTSAEAITIPDRIGVTRDRSSRSTSRVSAYSNRELSQPSYLQVRHRTPSELRRSSDRFSVDTDLDRSISIGIDPIRPRSRERSISGSRSSTSRTVVYNTRFLETPLIPHTDSQLKRTVRYSSEVPYVRTRASSVPYRSTVERYRDASVDAILYPKLSAIRTASPYDAQGAETIYKSVDTYRLYDGQNGSQTRTTYSRSPSSTYHYYPSYTKTLPRVARSYSTSYYPHIRTSDSLTGKFPCLSNLARATSYDYGIRGYSYKSPLDGYKYGSELDKYTYGYGLSRYPTSFTRTGYTSDHGYPSYSTKTYGYNYSPLASTGPASGYNYSPLASTGPASGYSVSRGWLSYW